MSPTPWVSPRLRAFRGEDFYFVKPHAGMSGGKRGHDSLKN